MELFWVNIETRKLDNLPAARNIWESRILKKNGKSAQWRVAYINFERLVVFPILKSDIKKIFVFRSHKAGAEFIRQLFERSLEVVPSSDKPEYVAKQWLQFEREEGNFSSMKEAKSRYTYTTFGFKFPFLILFQKSGVKIK